MEQIWFWIAFNAIIIALLIADLKLFHKNSHIITIKEAAWLSAFWIGLAFIFNLFILFWYGKEAALNFLSGYLVEKALSVDNLFVFTLIFSYFKVPDFLLHKVLFWGILGAIIMRALFIVGGIALIHHFYWILYIFGLFLIITGIKLALEKEKKIQPDKNLVLQLFQRLIPAVSQYHGNSFFVRNNNKYFATPLFFALLAVEVTDIIFAIDSIPAIIGITKDPFIIYTSNILAILGLRSLYFALAHAMKLFHFLHYGLAAILIFIGFKMLLEWFIAIPIWFSLTVILAVFSLTIFASYLFPKKNKF